MISSRPVRRSVRLSVAATIVALCLGATACSDDADDASADRSTTTEAGVTTSGADAGAESDGAPVTDPGAPDTTDPAAPADGDASPTTDAPRTTAKPAGSAGATTSLLPAASGLPEVLTKNSQGQDIALDETALLACAQNQIAWVALEQESPAEAADALRIASDRAADSAVDEVKAASAGLDAAADGTERRATVDDFLALCVARGFEY